MINLIPNKEQKIMVKDFYLRLIIVILFALSFIVFIALVVLLPSYFISSVNVDVSNEKLDIKNIEEIKKTSQNTIFIISSFDKQLSLIEEANSNKFLISEKIIKEIILKKTSNIKINQIIFEDSEDGKTVGIRGTASSRERLLFFHRSLKNDPLRQSELNFKPFKIEE